MGLGNRTTETTYTYAQRPFKTVASFNHDGVELARVRKQRSSRLPIRHIVLFLLAIVSFKLFLNFDMGAAAYGAKIEEFSAGTVIEQAAAWAMTLDPVSQWILDGVRFGKW